ncbi:uncharacterized protein SPSK_10082 [Sporothrix schenckii 1099-18]|uniref:Uncharacterized protein n=1 Tax=Sporothrix schenckii 1099-18 TaxID=1397361 RepID=A0A0F2MB00_SPOSC|nr:uncharacterized protein SPSK_10082 [Sporothrix schenckii 1099-18]KJR85980.1 hypothetical protein SPSK_10082 [Sporothrix schenckii 1099-18]
MQYWMSVGSFHSWQSITPVESDAVIAVVTSQFVVVSLAGRSFPRLYSPAGSGKRFNYRSFFPPNFTPESLGLKLPFVLLFGFAVQSGQTDALQSYHLLLRLNLVDLTPYA